MAVTEEEAKWHKLAKLTDIIKIWHVLGKWRRMQMQPCQLGLNTAKLELLRGVAIHFRVSNYTDIWCDRYYMWLWPIYTNIAISPKKCWICFVLSERYLWWGPFLILHCVIKFVRHKSKCLKASIYFKCTILLRR